MDETLGTGALAANALAAAAYDESVNERSFILSQEAVWSMDDHTAGEGPITVGVAHSDYTQAEIEEVIENTGSWNEGNLVAQEQARRKIRIVGVFDGLSVDEKLNDGLPIKTILKWVLLQNQSLQMFCYNHSSAALTTGSLIKINGHVWIKPL